MAFKKLLLNNCLIFITAIAFFTSGSSGDDSVVNDYRFPDYTQIPKHYDITPTPREITHTELIVKLIIKLYNYVKQHVGFANIIAEKVTPLLESEWKIMKEISKMDHVVVIPHFWDDMSNITHLHREDDFIYDDKIDSVAHKMEMTRLMGCKITYKVIDGTINPAWWSDLWLNEGLSLLIRMDAVDKIITHQMDLFIVQNQHESLQLNSYFVITQEQVDNPFEINSLLYFPLRIKAFCLLRMLQHLLSHNIFWKGAQIYLNNDHSATSDNLWNAMQIALNKINLNYKPDIKKVMNSWTQQKHYPVIKARNFDNGWIDISMSDFNELNESWIPLTFTTQSNFNFNDTSINETLWLSCTPQSSSFIRFYNPEIHDWIIINLQQSGYYRVNYDDKNWLKIATYLKTSNYMNIHVLNRAKIIDDAFHFMVAGELSASVFWNLTSYLSQETDFTAWYPMFKVFEHISTIFPFSDKRVEEIKARMHQMLDGVLEKTGYDEKDEDSKRLIREAAKWACLIRHSGCMDVAKDILYQHLTQNFKKNETSLWWKELMYCNGFIAFNVMWFQLANKLDVKFVSCSDKATIIIDHLKLIAHKENSERMLVTAFHSIVARHAKNDAVLEYLLSRFDEIRPRRITTVAALIDIINHVYSSEQLIKISKFVENHFKRHLISSHLISDVQHKIDIRMSQINNQMSYIQIWNS